MEGLGSYNILFFAVKQQVSHLLTLQDDRSFSMSFHVLPPEVRLALTSLPVLSVWTGCLLTLDSGWKTFSSVTGLCFLILLTVSHMATTLSWRVPRLSRLSLLLIYHAAWEEGALHSLGRSHVTASAAFNFYTLCELFFRNLLIYLNFCHNSIWNSARRKVSHICFRSCGKTLSTTFSFICFFLIL